MPVLKCQNDKWRIGKGKCIYDTKENAERAYKGYLGSKHGSILERIQNIREVLNQMRQG